MAKRKRVQITATLEPENLRALRAVGDKMFKNTSEMIDAAIAFYLLNRAADDLDTIQKTKAAISAVASHRGTKN